MIFTGRRRRADLRRRRDSWYTRIRHGSLNVHLDGTRGKEDYKFTLSERRDAARLKLADLGA